jgi:TPR repeat protein
MLRKEADLGHADAEYHLGKAYACGEGVYTGVIKKDLPLGKRYLELSAAQGFEDAVALLKELRKCVACGKLDVHHMICSRCYNRRYCDTTCQLRHWESATDPHKLHCVKRRAAAEAGGSSSERVDPSSDNNERCAVVTQAAAVATAQTGGG